MYIRSVVLDEIPAIDFLIRSTNASQDLCTARLFRLIPFDQLLDRALNEFFRALVMLFQSNEPESSWVAALC